MKNVLHKRTGDLYGITTVGEKGQAVIPAGVRKRMGLKVGEQLLVFCSAGDMVVFSKISRLEKTLYGLKKSLQTGQRAAGSKKRK